MKTAASKRDDEHKQAVRQNVIYPALVKLKNLLDIKYFEYWVMTKTSNPTIEDICFEVTADPVLEVKAKLDELRQAEEDNIFPPKR